MLFSSVFFLYTFLPILLMVYFIVPMSWRNAVLLIASLLFYYLGEPRLVWVLILSSVVNYSASKCIAKHERYAKFILILSLSYNILQLIYFKYVDFFIANFNALFHTKLSLLYVVMPIGISFFTFQGLSYVVDVYRKEVKASSNFLDFMMYLSFFPQLVAGPIVRYKDIQDQIHHRKFTLKQFSEGVNRFVFGLAKKVLLANLLGELVVKLDAMLIQSVLSYWLKAIAFTLQIYFDFSAYSDMAIGLGLMFGFRFLENFNYPFMADSITNFWRRWHMSLSSFFKDYVYIPLGGSRKSTFLHYRNILIVWFLTGFWHGAAWNFIIWGLYFAVLLMIEKKILLSKLEKTRILKHVYTLFFVVLSFVLFNANSMLDLKSALRGMFGLDALRLVNHETLYYLRSYGFVFALAIFFSLPLKKLKQHPMAQTLQPLWMVLCLLISSAYLIDSSFNPFLYFRF